MICADKHNERSREQKKKQNGDAGNRTRVEEKGHSRPTCVVHVILHMRARHADKETRT